jgi:hypothetical protein
MMFFTESRLGWYVLPRPKLLSRSQYLTLTKKPCDVTMSYYISNLDKAVNPLLF